MIDCPITGIGFPSGFFSWNHWYKVVSSFCASNALWLSRENHKTWAYIQCCEARVIAVNDRRVHRDVVSCVSLGETLTRGPAPVPEWERRGRYIQRKLRPMCGVDGRAISVVDVGLDVVPDYDWAGTWGITQNEVFDTSMERINYSLMYGLPHDVYHESSTESSLSGAENETESLTQIDAKKSIARAGESLQTERATAFRIGFWPGRRVNAEDMPSPPDESDSDRHAAVMKELYDDSLAVIGKINRIIAERADSDLSLDASNNMSVESTSR